MWRAICLVVGRSLDDRLRDERKTDARMSAQVLRLSEVDDCEIKEQGRTVSGIPGRGY